jgi:hypothetical protein
VFLPGRGIHGLSGLDFDDVAAAGLHAGDALGDVQGLPIGVAVPGRASTRREPDDADDHALVLALWAGDDVEPHVASELFRRVLHCWRLRSDKHGPLLSLVVSFKA